MWILGFELRPSGLAASTFTDSAHLASLRLTNSLMLIKHEDSFFWPGVLIKTSPPVSRPLTTYFNSSHNSWLLLL